MKVLYKYRLKRKYPIFNLTEFSFWNQYQITQKLQGLFPSETRLIIHQKSIIMGRNIINQHISYYFMCNWVHWYSCTNRYFCNAMQQLIDLLNSYELLFYQVKSNKLVLILVILRNFCKWNIFQWRKVTLSKYISFSSLFIIKTCGLI